LATTDILIRNPEYFKGVSVLLHKVCTQIFIYVCVCGCVCVCIYIYIYMHTCICIYMHMYVCACVCIHTHTHTHTYIYIHIYRHQPRTCGHTCSSASLSSLGRTLDNRFLMLAKSFSRHKNNVFWKTYLKEFFWKSKMSCRPP
jgi:hypothetical protein